MRLLWKKDWNQTHGHKNSFVDTRPIWKWTDGKVPYYNTNSNHAVTNVFLQIKWAINERKAKLY